MSLYDDLPLDSQWTRPAIHLLHAHLQRRPKREPRARPVPRPRPAPEPELPLSGQPPAAGQLVLARGSLLGGDWDHALEYEATWPNDYEALVRERHESEEARAEAVKPESEDTERRGAAIAPPLALQEPSVAQKIMERMGFKAGQGLGKERQGIAQALQVERVSRRQGRIVAEEPEPAPEPAPEPPELEQDEQSITDLLRRPSKVVLLRNMVGRGHVDDDLAPEVQDECRKYGDVSACHVLEDPRKDDDEAVRIFVEFARVEAAVKAVVDLNGRFFGGRSVRASFFDWDKFKRQQWDE